MPGTILMGVTARTRRAYRVLEAVKAKGPPALGCSTWRLRVERMSAEAGRAEIAAGAPGWSIEWDSRKRKPG